MAAAVIWRGSELLLVKRPAGGRSHDPGTDRGWWAGMWQFPSGEVGAGETTSAAAARLAREVAGLNVRPEAAAGVVRHGVTRWRITLEAWHCYLLAGDAPAADRRWTPLEETAHLALPAPHRRLVEQIERQAASGSRQAEQPPLLEV
jgi:A/G-specific adenine glycosylase